MRVSNMKSAGIGMALVIVFLSNTLHAQEIQKINVGTDRNGNPMKGDYVSLNMTPVHYSASPSNLLVVAKDKDGFTHNFIYRRSDMQLAAQPSGTIKAITDDGYMTEGGAIIGTTMHDLNGKKRWRKNLQLVGTTPDGKLCIFQKSLNRHSDEFIALRASDGGEQWRTFISHNLHYPFAHAMADQSRQYLLLIGDSLLKLNVTTGQTIGRPFAGGVKEPMKSRFKFVWRTTTALTLKNRNDVALSEEPFIKSAFLTATHSNFIRRKDRFYVADADSIYCMDYELRTIWATALPEGMGSNSEIRLQGDSLMMKNYGVAFQKGCQTRYGKPFAAIFDRNNGKEISLQIIEKKPSRESVEDEDIKISGWITDEENDRMEGEVLLTDGIRIRTFKNGFAVVKAEESDSAQP